MSRPLAAVPNIFATEGTGTLNNIALLDADFAAVLSAYNDSAIGYVNYGADTGTANSYVVTLAAAPSAYIAGMMLAVKIGASNTNTGGSNINVNALGSVAICNPAGLALLGGELPANAVIPMVYDGTVFRIIGNCPMTNNLNGQSGNVTINCAGYTSVDLYITWTSGSGLITALNNLSAGIPIFLWLQNLTGANTGFAVHCTTAQGVSIPGTVAYTNTSGGSTSINLYSGYTINSGQSMYFVGSANTINNVLFKN